MSDPVSSMDVEDVLSSIRRLVSEEAKGGQGADPSDLASADLHEAAETAAADALDELVMEIEESSELPIGLPPSNDDASGGDDELLENDEPASLAFRHKGNRKVEDQRLVLTAALRVADPEPPVQSSHPHLRPVDDIIEDEFGDGSGGAEKLNSMSFNVAPDETLFQRARRGLDASKETSRPLRASLELDEAAKKEKVPEAPFVEAVDPEDADLEDAFVVSGEVDIDATHDDVSSASPFRAAGGMFDGQAIGDETEADAEPDALIVEGEDEASTINFAEEEESVLDEDTLRDLVSQMVREELQGELGDRITRNVRKLVRREIQRAIASREFE